MTLSDSQLSTLHGNVVPAGPSNISPWPRSVVFLSLCEVTNHIRRFKRPALVARRDFTPIAALTDDCLSTLNQEGEAVA